MICLTFSIFPLRKQICSKLAVTGEDYTVSQEHSRDLEPELQVMLSNRKGFFTKPKFKEVDLAL
jgi:hypothetical protein